MSIKVPFCPTCRCPHVPEEIAARVRNGEQIDIDIIYQSGVAANVQKWGTGAINVDGCRVPAESGANFSRPVNHTGIHEGWDRPWKHDPEALARERVKRDGIEQKATELGRWPANVVLSVPEDEYELKPFTSTEQKRELYRWLSENA